MDTDHFRRAFREALQAIDNPRLFETERGYQGELLAQLGRRIELAPEAIVEQEYQKQVSRHGLAIRPDIIIHEPFDERRHSGRDEGNFAVIELKLKASRAKAVGDFHSLARMIEVLKYPLGVFVNIGSSRTFGGAVPDTLKGRIISYGVTLVDGRVEVVEERP